MSIVSRAAFFLASASLGAMIESCRRVLLWNLYDLTSYMYGLARVQGSCCEMLHVPGCFRKGVETRDAEEIPWAP